MWDKIIKGATSGWLLQIITVVTQLTITPYVLENLGKEILGYYAIFLQVLLVLTLLDLGIPTALSRRFSQIDKEDRLGEYQRVYSSIEKPIIIINICIAIFAIIISKNLDLLNVGVEVVKEFKYALWIIAIWYIIRTN